MGAPKQIGITTNNFQEIVKMEKKISIIIPVYNASDFLQKSIGSVINQTYRNIEILCINDGSADKSLEILQDFSKKDNRIKVFDQQNLGVARARNVGLENATGEYLMFCDADDWYQPTMCEDMLVAITKHNVDFVMCDVNLVYDVGVRGDDISYYRIPTIGYYELKTPEDKITVNVLVWNKIFKTALVRKYNISFPDGCVHEDDAFLFQYLAIASDAYFLDDKLYNYLMRLENSVMAGFLNASHSKKTDRIKNVHFCYDWLVHNGMFGEYNALFSLFYSAQVKMNFRRLEENVLREMIEEEKKFLLKYEIEGTKLIDIVKNKSVGYCVRRFSGKRNKYKLLRYSILSKITFGNARDQYRLKLENEKRKI